MTPNGDSGFWKRTWQRFTSQERRRARRRTVRGVVAYYWEGGVAHPHEVVNMSETGAFVSATSKWYPGTIIEMTLQREGGDGDPSPMAHAAVHLQSKVVRTESDGAGLRFVYSKSRERLGVREFLKAVRPRKDGSGNSGGEGQALIEFALVLPLILLLIMNLVNFGAFIYAWITVANAARAGAQHMIVGGAWVGGPVPPDSSSVVTLATDDAKWLPNAASLQVTVCKNNRGTLEPSGCGGTWGPPTDPEPGLYTVGAVDVSYTYQPVIPLWDFPNLGIHLTLPATTIHRRATMRMVQ